MQYAFPNEISALVAEKLVTARRHPRLPLTIYNYTVTAQFKNPSEWPEPLKDCRGLILDDHGEIVARPFKKFWNYEQVADQIPNGEAFSVFEKVDGSLGIVATYCGERIVATRGSFESDQAKWFAHWLNERHPTFYPSDTTWLFEIVYPENRIVVDYGATKAAFLLAVQTADAMSQWNLFYGCQRFRKASRFDGLKDFSTINSAPQFAGQEGFVIVWESGFRAKVKLEEYKRLHRLITQCSTRTIWELLRSGKGVDELIDHVPNDFRSWVSGNAALLAGNHRDICSATREDFSRIGHLSASSRKDFAQSAKACRNPGLLFSLLDGKDITDSVWRLVEPQWSTPFRTDTDA